MTHANEPKAGRRNPSCFFYASILDGGGDRRDGGLFLAAAGNSRFYHSETFLVSSYMPVASFIALLFVPLFYPTAHPL